MEIECLMEQKFNIDLNNKSRYINNMKIKDINVEEYIELFDGSVEGCKLIKMLDNRWGLYENVNGKFIIENYNKEEEYIFRVV